MNINKHGIIFTYFKMTWGIGGSICNGNGYKWAWIRFSILNWNKYITSPAWKIGNGDDGNRTLQK